MAIGCDPFRERDEPEAHGTARVLLRRMPFGAALRQAAARGSFISLAARWHQLDLPFAQADFEEIARLKTKLHGVPRSYQ